MERTKCYLKMYSGIAIVTGLLTFATNAPAADFEPISHVSADANIRLTVLGRYWGGWFSRSTPPAPAYDRKSQRLFVGSDDRHTLEILDISDPSEPALFKAVDLSLWGSEPNRLAQSHGIVAVVVTDDTKPDSSVLFFNADGDMVAEPVAIEGGREIAFSPNGKKLIVTIESVLEDPYSELDSGIAVLDLKSTNWGVCRNKPSKCHLDVNVEIASFNIFNDQRDELVERGVRLPFASLPYTGITVSRDLQPAAVTIGDNSRTAWISLVANNAIVEVDLNTAEITNIYGLGSKDNSVAGNGIDASDKDGMINIRTWPLRSFYAPDGIRVVGGGSNAYLVTANEGDPRDPEVERGRNLVLDPVQFPDAATLQEDSNLGRLKISIVDGDTDGDGDLDELFTFGSRSFSTWSTSGQLLFDSGDDFEQITAQVLPDFFNAAEDENEFDKRSDDRGPEPEGLAVGKLYGQHYAFVTFERIGGVIVYDITDPQAPRFQQYINNRNFGVEPKDVCGSKGNLGLPTCPLAGDLEPEGILFIPREESPIDAPLLAVTYELSDSTSLFRIDRTD